MRTFSAMFAFALWCLVLLHRVDDAHGRFGSRGTTLLPKPASDREKLRWNIPLDNWSRRDEILSAIALSARGGGNRPRSTGSPPSQQLEAWGLHTTYTLKCPNLHHRS
jgi:hypothetical protein